MIGIVWGFVWQAWVIIPASIILNVCIILAAFSLGREFPRYEAGPGDEPDFPPVQEWSDELADTRVMPETLAEKYRRLVPR